MKRTIAFCGISSLVGILISSVAAIIATIWVADFASKVCFTSMCVFGVTFFAALAATSSPLYKD